MKDLETWIREIVRFEIGALDSIDVNFGAERYWVEQTEAQFVVKYSERGQYEYELGSFDNRRVAGEFLRSKLHQDGW